MIRRFALSLLFLLALTCGASAVGCAGTGSCFWEGGTGNWSDTTKWCTTNTNPCTGATGAVPTFADNCNFTSVSNSTAYTVTQDTNPANCLNMSWAAAGDGTKPTFTGSQTVNIFGNLTLVVGMTWNINAGVQFLAITTGKTVTTAGVTLTNSGVVFAGNSGGWTLQDDLTLSATKTITVTAGTLNTNAKTVTAGFFVSTSGTRTLTLDNSTINITGTSGTPWNVSTAGTLTFSATGSTINVNGGTANTSLTLAWGSLTYGTINVTATGLISSATFTAKNFSYTSTTDKRDQFIHTGLITIAASGSLTIAGNSAVNRAFILSSILGTQKLISVPNTATVTLTNVDFQDIASAGTFGTWTGTSLGDALGNSGITFDGSTTQTYAGGTNNWSTLAAWTSRVPLPQDDVVVNTTTAGTLTADMPRLGRNIDFTSFTRTVALTSLANQVYGNFTLSSLMTLTISQQLQLFGRGSQTFTSATKQPNAILISAFGGTYTLQDSLTNSGALTLTNGTLAAGSNDISSLSFNGNVSTTCAITGSGTWSFSSTAGNVWLAGSGLTTTGFTGTIKLTGNNSTTSTFIGGGKTYGNLWWSNTAATGTLIITGANTFNDFKINRTTARSITFPAATITTIGSWTDESLGTAVLTIISSSAGSQATLRKTSGIVSTDYLSLKDNAATGGAAFFAGNHSSQVSNVTGWIFAGPGGGGLLTMGVGGWLMERDLNPANDNNPVGLDRAA